MRAYGKDAESCVEMRALPIRSHRFVAGFTLSVGHTAKRRCAPLAHRNAIQHTETMYRRTHVQARSAFTGGKILITLLALTAVVTLGLWGVTVALEPTSVRSSVAPDHYGFPGAVVQVYGADVWGVRGRFAIHTWITTKPAGARSYTIYQVIGWRQRRGESVVSISEGRPDSPWFRSPAVLLHEIAGDVAEPLVERVHEAALAYPYPREYTMWPGPNSNSFTAWIALKVPELGLDLPVKAIGKDWMIETHGSEN